VLAFTAAKLATARWIEVTPAVSIGIIALCIGATIWPSVRALRTCGVRRSTRPEIARDRYATSKLCNLLTVAAIARRVPPDRSQRSRSIPA
jgi:hypothetical protein